ncbi:hypothetical protein AOLI_G00052160 [Acnodon oligacanthus]
MKMNFFCALLLLLSSYCVTQGKISEYQLESETRSQCELLRGSGSAQQKDHIPQCSEDGRYRHVQCNNGGECWCVNGDGTEIPGSRQNGSVVHCLTSCQLQRQRALQSGDAVLVPYCLDSGEYEPVQCDGALTQCWCVDLEGMEIYGTRQNGRPSTCPSVCEVRQRRLLHGVGEASPPQCSDDGSFLPVQCKFINTTNMMVFDLLHAFNRLPEVFQTFSSFRKAFPELSSYCYCTDTRGRELPSTGLELLMDEVYDTAFSGLDAERSFSQSNMYRILQRRYLAVQLALTGRFRCPTPCESERSASSQAGNIFVPSCDARGQYLPTQCQIGGQCWCVNSEGKEIFGTRQRGVPDCSTGGKDCRTERRQALSRLFYGPAGHFSQNDVFSMSQANTQRDTSPLAPCSPEFQELLTRSGLVRSLPESEHSEIGDIMAELVQGMFPTGALALKALSLTTNPKRLQENLFGGKFLKNAGNFNFTGTIGTRGTLSFSQAFAQVGLTQNGEDLQQLAKIFSAESVSLNLDQEISDTYGHSVNLQRNRNLIKLIGSTLENEQFFTTLREAITLLKAEDSTQLGHLFQTVFQSHDVCKSAASPSPLYVPQCTEDGLYQVVQCQGSECWCVDSQGLEIAGSRSTGFRPRCPSQCEKEYMMAIAVKASSSAGSEVFIPKCKEDGEYVPLQCLGKICFCMDRTGAKHNTLVSGNTLQSLHFYWQSSIMTSERDRQSLALGYQPYSPQCDAYGQWLPSQCYPSTGHSWCVNEEGGYIPGSLTARALQPPQCQTPCQRLQAHFILSVWTKATSDMSLSYSPSCEENGEFSVLQRNGSVNSVASCVSPVTGRIIQPATLNPDGDLQCPGWCALQQNLAAEREAGVGYEPECVEEGRQFSPRQCDTSYCWCVSESGQELPATRIDRSSGKTTSCDSPQCPLPFGDSISHGAVVCDSETVAGGQRQRCRVFCQQGYINAFPVDSFLCDPVTKIWLSDAPLSYTCQRAQPLQTVHVTSVLQLSVVEGQQDCSGQHSTLQASLLHDMRAAGLCSLQLSSGQYGFLSVCDESSVSLECVSEQSLTASITLKAHLYDLPVNVLPDLHDIDTVFSSEKILDGLMEMVRSGSYRSVFVSERAVGFSSPAYFSCSVGYQQLPDSTGCGTLPPLPISLLIIVACPAGTFYSGGKCDACPHGSYQAETGKEFCSPCPSGTSTAAPGAFSPSHCVSACQKSKLRCTDRGDFVSAQKHFLSGKWLCITSQGEELSWTSADEQISAEQCKVLEKFEAVPVSSLLLDSVDAVVLRSDSSSQPLETQLRACVLDCANDDSCQHVAVYYEGTQTLCDLYSTSTANIDCRTSQQRKGFLGNEGAETFQTLSCLLKVKVGDKPNLTVLRKKGHEFSTAGQKSFERLSFHKASSGVYRTLVFEAPGATLADVHHVCVDSCSQESCCDGFILNQNVLNGGSVMCGLLSFPAVLQCSEDDWDVSAVASSSRICGAGVKYNKQQKRFTFEFGGQNFTITDKALPTSSKNKTDYQATIIGFQRVYLWKESDMSTRLRVDGSCQGAALLEAPKLTLSDSVKETFNVLDSGDVRIDSEKNTPRQQYWVFKHQFTKEEAQLWCLKRCVEEELCHVADLRDEGPVYYACILYPDTRVCGAYDKPLRQACSLVLPQDTHTAHQKKVDLTDSVESFYSRVPFKKMVSYSVRSRVSVSGKPITEGFFECERRCDEDPCCRGIGYVQDTGASDVLCLTLNSLGIQTCREDDRTEWRVQDCSPSKVQTGLYPFGWYEKPVNQWTRSPGICPSFKLRSPSKAVYLNDWKLLNASSVLVDSSVSTFDIVHISRDIAEDLDGVRDWCLAACEENDTCSAVSVASRESAVRCVMYPDTHICLPSSSSQHCVFLTKEPAEYVYLKTVLKPELTSVSIPGHGTLLGENKVKLIGADSKSVTYFLGVPYAHPPIGQLRFSAPQPADWTGSWNATFARPSCLQPGDTADSRSSEDCLYLNIFVPGSVSQGAPVLMFFHNSGSGLLDGSYLATVGDIIVVTANFRVAAFGFLSTGSSALLENYGLQDQAAALGWVQENVARFGGDPTRVTVGADRNGADIASLHLFSSSSLFHQALLMVRPEKYICLNHEEMVCQNEEIINVLVFSWLKRT